MARTHTGKPRRSSSTSEVSTKELLAGAVPPQNLDAERAVLGAVLRDNFVLNDFVARLEVDHFYSAKHQKIYKTMVEMFEEAKPIDVVTLGEELAKKAMLIEIGGAPALLEMYEETLTAANVRYHSNIVYEKGTIRALIHASTEILRDAYEGTTSAEELMADAEKKVFSILEKGVVSGAEDIGSILHKAFDRISERQKNGGGGPTGVPTDFYDLDGMTNGWQNSELIILAARPSMGKTALALNFIEAASVNHNMPCFFVSLEMSQLELAERLLCSRARVNGDLLRKQRLSSDDMQKLIATSAEFSTSPLYIDDTPGQTMLRISATARRLKLRHGLRMIVVDYLQLIEPDDKTASRQEQIGAISRRLKNLARELQVPLIALSQLNRGVEAREGHRPRMSDLRESGSIEQDADVVCLLHRDDFYSREEKPNEAEIIIAKQRNGPVGDVRLTFRKESTRFENFAPELGTHNPSAGEF